MGRVLDIGLELFLIKNRSSSKSSIIHYGYSGYDQASSHQGATSTATTMLLRSHNTVTIKPSVGAKAVGAVPRNFRISAMQEAHMCLICARMMSAGVATGGVLVLISNVITIHICDCRDGR